MLLPQPRATVAKSGGLPPPGGTHTKLHAACKRLSHHDATQEAGQKGRTRSSLNRLPQRHSAHVKASMQMAAAVGRLTHTSAAEGSGSAMLQVEYWRIDHAIPIADVLDGVNTPPLLYLCRPSAPCSSHCLRVPSLMIQLR